MRSIVFITFCLLLGACNGAAESSAANQPSEPAKLEQVFGGLRFHRAVRLLQHPTKPELWYVLEQYGKIFRVDENGQHDLFTDIKDEVSLQHRCNECGLLGMDFHPDFKNNGTIYLSFNEKRKDGMYSVVARFKTSNQGQSIDLTSRQDIFDIIQPYRNHNGGDIKFGPDGYLYIGLGDGGAADDPPNNGQTKSNPLGAMLRVDENGTAAPNNIEGADSRVFAYGLRNPWRFSFDRETGALWAADVGQNDYEEVDIIKLGKNYGWRCIEGFEKTTNRCTTSEEYIDPVAAYGRSEGISITGGYVYRGTKIPQLFGAYIFGDYGSGTIWSLHKEGDEYKRKLLMKTKFNISSFGEDAQGELYVINHDDKGRIYKLVPTAK